MPSLRSRAVRLLIRHYYAPGFAARVPLERQRANLAAGARLARARGVEVQPVRAGGMPAEWLCGIS